MEVAAGPGCRPLRREHGAKVPARLVSSAKSWLSHPGVDRRGPILPWTAPDEVPRVSPVAASAAYLEHLRDAWNTQKSPARRPLIVSRTRRSYLTVPASFDPVARELTMEAAAHGRTQTGHPARRAPGRLLCLARRQGRKWRKQVKVGDVILVCDVGGGTTDFTLDRRHR